MRPEEHAEAIIDGATEQGEKLSAMFTEDVKGMLQLGIMLCIGVFTWLDLNHIPDAESMTVLEFRNLLYDQLRAFSESEARNQKPN